MNVLITGGGGFIGSRLAEALKQRHPDARVTPLAVTSRHGGSLAGRGVSLLTRTPSANPSHAAKGFSFADVWACADIAAQASNAAAPARIKSPPRT